MSSLEDRIRQIEERNSKVELEKAWETSLFRKFSILVITYLLMVVVFFIMGNPNYLLNAIVPTVGYFLSTMSLGALKRFWLSRR